MSGGKKERQKNMTFTKSVFVFAFVVAALLTVTVGLGGPAHVAMLIAAIVAGIVAVGSGYSWNELQDGIGDTIKAAVPAILILLAIGVIISVWLLGGIVPTMIGASMVDNAPPDAAHPWYRYPFVSSRFVAWLDTHNVGAKHACGSGGRCNSAL